MVPPTSPQQISVLRAHYTKAGDSPVAFIDETYHVDLDGRERFYTVAAVVVAADDLDPLRKDLDELVPSGWWHTSEQLRTDQGYADAREMLSMLEAPHDACVLVDHVAVDDTDTDGLAARRAVLRTLLTTLHQPPHALHASVRLAIAEEHRVARVNNYDRSTRAMLVQAGSLPANMGLVHASPGSEHLLWLPDVVCSAYRQAKLGRSDELFEEIRGLTHVTRLTTEAT